MGFTGRPSTEVDWLSMREAAKELGTGRTRLYNSFRELEIINDLNEPMTKYIENGFLKVHTKKVSASLYHRLRDWNVLLVSPNSLNYFRDLLPQMRFKKSQVYK
jgi:phage antirepressor YoqD-like protein